MRVSTPTSAAQNPILETVREAKQMQLGSRYSLCESNFNILSLKPGLKPSTHPRHTNWDAVGRYHGHIKELEQKAYPGEIGCGGMVSRDMGTSRGIMYAFFGPSWFFQSVSLVMTEAIVADLRDNNKSLLSVGCGPAYLERFLVSHLGIARKQITLADIDGRLVPQGFKYHQFDMLGEWPRFDQLFDYVIFPESAVPPQTGNNESLNLYHVFKSALAILKPGGQIRATYVNDRVYEPFEQKVRADLPTATVGFFTTMAYLVDNS